MRVTFLVLLLGVAAVWNGTLGYAEQPLRDPVTKEMRQPPPSGQSGQPQAFYGYVPPAPLRHTWPGGYRVITHELVNTFIYHLLGRY